MQRHQVQQHSSSPSCCSWIGWRNLRAAGKLNEVLLTMLIEQLCRHRNRVLAGTAAGSGQLICRVPKRSCGNGTDHCLTNWQRQGPANADTVSCNAGEYADCASAALLLLLLLVPLLLLLPC
jgi:hypothetical protein